MQPESILSVGIDVGTTSTHLTVSRLHLSNISRPTEPTRLVIDRREIIYQSPIHLTPLSSDGCIDADRVADILRSEYELAAVVHDDIATGAVIVTGETARKRNAAQISEMLAGLAGKFVVASAGPNLESILAARGSGAMEASQRDGSTICNVDIGGGTTNIAVYRNGLLLSTACLGIGGRFLQLNEQLMVSQITEFGETIGAGRLAAGQTAALETLRAVAADSAFSIVQCLLARATFCSPLLITAPLQFDGQVDCFWFSGGVAELMNEHQAKIAAFGDLGVLLAEQLLLALSAKRLPFRIAEQPIRATVIGAGTHSLQLSGSTVAVSAQTLPIANLPIIRPRCAEPAHLRQAIDQCLLAHDLNWQAQPVALLLPELGRLNYPQVSAWAQALSDAVKSLGSCAPLVVICAHDVAAALGQSLRKRLPNHPQVVLDGISNSFGDYIDIGEPLVNRQAIPVVLKELVFAAGG